MDPQTPATVRAAAATDEARSIQVAGHELTLFVESRPMIDAMAADIASAQNRVWLESYTIAADAAGQAIGDALEAQARDGRDVRVLYDAIGSQGTAAALFSRLRAAGAEVHAFHSLLYALRNFSLFEILNRRNHRKLLVIDDRVAYFGGMNIVDTVHPGGGATAGDLSEAGGWRDLHVRIVGPQVADVAESFERPGAAPIICRSSAGRGPIAACDCRAGRATLFVFMTADPVCCSRERNAFLRVSSACRGGAS